MSNKVNNGYALVEVNVILDVSTLDEFRVLNPEVKVRMRKNCGWHYPCAVYLLPASEADCFNRLQATEAKREQRQARCMVPDGRGGFIHCNERNKCQNCPKVGSLDFDNGHPTSLDALHFLHDKVFDEQDWLDDSSSDMDEPLDCSDLFSNNVNIQIEGEIIKRLSAMKPKYAAIFAERLKGNYHSLSIARTLGLGKSQIAVDMPKVMEAARKIFFELTE